MSKSAYPLKLPVSVKAAAARLAKADGVSLNQFIAVAVAEKVGVLEAGPGVPGTPRGEGHTS
jgi:predicted HicB family RNase H-like nuclease